MTVDSLVTQPIYCDPYDYKIDIMRTSAVRGFSSVKIHLD